LVNTINDSPAASPGTRPAENILVKIKDDKGTVTEVPLLMLMADLYGQLEQIKLRLSVVEASLTSKNRRIVEV